MKINIKYSTLILIILIVLTITSIFFVYNLIEKQKDLRPQIDIDIKSSIEKALKNVNTIFEYDEIITKTSDIRLGKEALLCIKVRGIIKVGSKIKSVESNDHENDYTIYIEEPSVINHDMVVVEDIVINRLFNKISGIDFLNIQNEHMIYLENKIMEDLITMSKRNYEQILSGYQKKYNDITFDIQYVNNNND